MRKVCCFLISQVENTLSGILTLRSLRKCRTPDQMRAFLIISHPEIFYTVGDNLTIGMIAKLTSYLLSFMSSYRDLFVMCISLALSIRFQQVNKILLHHKGKSMLPNFYAEHRLFHRNLVSLVSDADKVISSITMLALSNNLFYICSSLLNSL